MTKLIDRMAAGIRRRRVSLGLAWSSLLAACSPLGMLDAVTPAGAYDGRTDIPYGKLERQRLDVYLPQGVSSPRAILVFFYGGGWRSGSRQGYRFVAEALTRQGFAVVIPDYRLHPEVSFPTFLEDGAAAIAWVQAHRGELAPASTPLFLMGHSAGAYITVMLALDPRYLQAQGVNRQILAGAIGISGPYDFLPMYGRYLRDIFDVGRPLPETQPITFAGSGGPPLLLLQGEGDNVVRPRNATELAARVHAAGGKAKPVLYPGVGHIEILVGLSTRLKGDSRLMDDLLAFVANP